MGLDGDRGQGNDVKEDMGQVRPAEEMSFEDGPLRGEGDTGKRLGEKRPSVRALRGE